MNYLITESQYNLLTEQKTLVYTLNSVNFINNLITLVRTLTRGVESYLDNPQSLEILQSLLKQSLSGGKKNLTEKDMEYIRSQEKLILNTVAKELGFENWTQLKETKVKELNKTIKSYSTD